MKTVLITPKYIQYRCALWPFKTNTIKKQDIASVRTLMENNGSFFGFAHPVLLFLFNQEYTEIISNSDQSLKVAYKWYSNYSELKEGLVELAR